MYIPLEYVFAVVTVVTAYATYRLGKRDGDDFRDDVVNSTIDYLIKENIIDGAGLYQILAHCCKQLITITLECFKIMMR